jgi:DNA mismatch repair protein MutL
MAPSAPVMAPIRVLPPELATQIAAGEVVERPASAAKELIENAIDAGASRIDVVIEGGGIPRLSVSDDGSGMNDDDARLSIRRHATSKLTSLSDLNRVKSFGFRGEALPSIASVSRFTLRTRTADSDAGIEVTIEGGGAPTLRPVGMAPGTVVDVRDLFYNVPARRKFLRSTGTESGHVTDVVQSAALARPQVTFTLERDGRRVREFLRAQSREERVAQAIADDELAPCSGERGPLRIEAFLSRPERARAGSQGLTILVNDRPIHDRGLALTIAQAYGSVLERGRYPRGVVYLELPPELVDVNVHPQKSEVRFADPRAITDAVYSVLSRALAAAFSLPSPQRSPWGRPQQPSPSGAPAAIPAASEAASTETTALQTTAAHVPEPDPWGLSASSLDAKGSVIGGDATATDALAAGVPSDVVVHTRRSAEPMLLVRDAAASAPIRPRPEVRWSNLRFISQLRQTYLLCEADDGLYVLDQHAAAERVTFTRLRRQYQSRAVSAQSLLFPITFDVSTVEASLIEEHHKQIADVGLDVRVRGSTLASVHAVPRLLQRASAERLVRDLLSELSRTGGRGFSYAVDLALATMACHGSIRAGDVLSATEGTALLRALDDADFAGHCPHGRPVVTFTSWAELERKVGRR